MIFGSFDPKIFHFFWDILIAIFIFIYIRCETFMSFLIASLSIYKTINSSPNIFLDSNRYIFREAGHMSYFNLICCNDHLLGHTPRWSPSCLARTPAPPARSAPSARPSSCSASATGPGRSRQSTGCRRSARWRRAAGCDVDNSAHKYLPVSTDLRGLQMCRVTQR